MVNKVEVSNKRIEQHYKPASLAKLYDVHAETIRELFRKEPGVFILERPEQMHKRGYSSMRIPESVAIRVMTQYTNKAGRPA